MLRIPVAEYLRAIVGAPYLATRPYGRQVRERVITVIQGTSNESIVNLDFEGVQFLDYSGSDELVVMLMNRIVNNELGLRYLVLSNLMEWHRENILVALERTKKHSLLEIRSEGLFLLGKVKPMLVNVLRAVYNQHVETARALADIAGHEINLASTKLSQLYQQRLIIRVESVLPEGGRQYMYRPVLPLTFHLE
ncbi:hypothetical protein [Alicyclobacillus sp. SO9]|uniref:hypothetical protein n=1 Tax=Alicyclobacillus sp. SO9 TaxID=2665646 RepID=UPI0018E86051|nr:hypothetical protein [Alicyclobacillus sp. SO9]QQE77290.1 hypothetical protein GI364_15125 [Alicyclobacillus sp. SO9]